MSDIIHEKIDIRGIPVDNVNLDEAFAAVLTFTKTDDFHMICTPNAEIVQQCIENEDTAALIRRSDLIIPDGAGVVLASKILGTPLKAKTPGCELGERIAKEAGKHGLRVYFLGGKPGIAELAEEKLRDKYPDSQTVGRRSRLASIHFSCAGTPRQTNRISGAASLTAAMTASFSSPSFLK